MSVMEPSSSDPALLAALRAGRSDAFERLYADYRAPIYNLCARIVGDREEAKDLTQEVFIAAFDRLPDDGAEPLKLRPWLYRVATNACFNHLRSRKRLSGGGDAELENAASGVDEFEQAQTVAYVEQSLGELNERYRTVLVLKDVQGLPVEEIAAVMEVSPSNADVLVHRARSSFKAAFAKLSGEQVPAPANLGLVLLPLALPAALKTMPALAAAAAGHAAGQAAGQAAGHAVGGLIGKISAALTTKVAIGAAAAVVVVGGTAAVYETHPYGAWRANAAPTHQWSSLAPGWGGTGAGHNRWRTTKHWRDQHWSTMGDRHWDSHAGRWFRNDGDHISTHDGGDGSGTGTSSATHDSGSGSWSGSHDGGGDMSGGSGDR